MKKNSKQQLLLEQIQNELKKHDYKITGPRLVIIEYLIRKGDHPDMQDICDEVIRDNPGIGVATVYRTVDLLHRLRILNIIELHDGRQRYEVNVPHDHHHHLVCTECKRIVEFGNCNFKQLVDSIEASTRFKIHSHTTVAYGTCPQCSLTN